MATSGSKTVGFCSRNGANRYYLQVAWERTSYSESGNYSLITVNLYLGSYGNGYGINASATKTGSISINGTSYSISKAGISLSSGGKIKIWGKSGIKITHATDGTKSFAISASFNPAVSISGSAIGTATISSTTFTLNTIPQASTISNSCNWTAGGNLTVNIARKSSSFTHTVQVLVGSTSISTKTGVGASTTFSFTSAENQNIFKALGTTASSASATVKVTTFKSGSQVGSVQSKSCTVTNVASSTTTYTGSANIGGTISGTISSRNKLFTHRIRLMQTNKSTAIATWMTNSTSSTAKSWSYTLPTSVYALTPNSNSYTCYIEITTYWNGTSQQIGSIRTGAITAKVTGSNPTFAPSTNFTYLDYNATTTAVTGNNQYLIQGYSKMKATLAAAGLATAKNSATIKEYHCTFAGKTIKRSHAASTACVFDFSTISASSNQTMTITAVDSRGNKTTVNKTVYAVPYQKPKVIVSAARTNGFTVNVPVSVKGSYSRITVAGTDKNTVSNVTHSLKVDSGTRPSQTKFTTITASGGNYNTNAYTYTLALTSIGSVRIGVADKLSTVTVDVDIATGLPLFYVDSTMGSVSFNKLPAYRSTLEMGLKFDVARNQFWGNGKASYGLNMQNSDLVGANSIVFSDSCNNLGEGLRFPNTTYAWNTDYGHTNPSTALPANPTVSDYKACYGDYTTVFFRNQEIWVDGSKFIKFGTSQIGTNNRAYNDLTFFGNSYVFQTYDVDVSTDKGFILDGTDGYRMHFDGNEVIAEKDGAYSQWYINASNAQFQNGVVTINGGLLYPNKGISVPQDIGSKFGHVKIINNTISNDTNGNILYLLVHNSGGTATHSLRVGYDETSSPAYIQSPATYSRTVTYAANMYITASGVYSRSTSSAKAKLDITPAFDSIDDYKKILNIEPVKWFDKNAMEATADAMTAEYNGEEIEQVDTFNLNRVYGCVAEQLEDVGLGCLVEYDSENEDIAGVAYDRIPIMYIPLIKDLYNQVDELKAEIQTLKGETGK